MDFENEVTKILVWLYPEIFTDTSASQLSDKEKIHIGDSCAARLCTRWQEHAQEIAGIHHEAEALVVGSSPIDLLDHTNGIAYELKYSFKNAPEEFYKDLFKVLIYNQSAERRSTIETFVFLCHYKGIKSISNSPLCQNVMGFMKKNGVQVELVQLFPKEMMGLKAA